MSLHALLLSTLLVLLSACGQKGPLILPQEETTNPQVKEERKSLATEKTIKSSK